MSGLIVAGTGGTVDGVLRAAEPDEAALLTDLALRSKAHWGYDEAFMLAYRGGLARRLSDVAAQRAVVAQAGGRVVGFYTLIGAPPQGKLDLLFVDPDHIGTGVGRRLWQHAVATARALHLERIILDADPHSEDFYLKLGAIRIGTVASGSIPGRLIPRLAYHL